MMKSKQKSPKRGVVLSTVAKILRMLTNLFFYFKHHIKLFFIKTVHFKMDVKNFKKKKKSNEHVLPFLVSVEIEHETTIL